MYLCILYSSKTQIWTRFIHTVLYKFNAYNYNDDDDDDDDDDNNNNLS